MERAILEIAEYETLQYSLLNSSVHEACIMLKRLPYIMALSALLTLAIAQYCRLLPLLSGNAHANSAGLIDFIEYWSAFKVWMAGGDIYSARDMLAAQTLISPRAQPLMMWNPPWTLLLLGPVISLSPFFMAGILWALLSIGTYVYAAVLISKAFDNKIHLLGWILTLSFPPLLSSLILGQLAALLLFGTSLCIYGFIKKSKPSLFIGLCIISIKPHLLFLFVILMVFNLIRLKDWSRLLVFPAAACFCLTLAWMANPLGLVKWANIISGSINVEGATNPNQWIGANLPSMVRYLLKDLMPDHSLALSSLPILLALLALPALLEISTRNLPLAVCLSIVISLSCAPFGWFLDQTLLLPAFLFLFSLRHYASSNILMLIAMIHFNYLAEFQHALWWFAPATLAVLWHSARNVRFDAPTI